MTKPGSVAERWLLAAVVGVVAATTVGCGDDNPPTVAPTPSAGTSIGPGSRYVALGDSYAAGPELGVDTGSTGCAQTAGNYAHLLAEQLELDLVDVSCGGADSSALTEEHKPVNGPAVPPQLDAVTSDTRLVTLTIGGNDRQIFNRLVTTCIGLGVKDPDGAPCTELVKEFDVPLKDQIEMIADRIDDAVTEIAERAPRARVVVIGYPQVFPARGTCDQLALANGDYPLAHAIVEQMVQAQRDGAKRGGAEFLDLTDVMAGHDMCSKDPWIAGAAPERDALPYHPYAAEQDAVADLLEKLVSSPRGS